MTNAQPCVFCNTSAKTLVWQSELVIAFRDGFPVSEGHTLVIPRRHVATYFDASPAEQADIWRAVSELRQTLNTELSPDGFNVGFNAGQAAGQTVMHLHVHIIPRFKGDMHDPRGGVRHVIPSKGNYLTTSAFESLPRFVAGETQHFQEVIHKALRLSDSADIVVAFVQESGVGLLRSDLEDALRRGTRVRLLTGDYCGITSADALRTLLRLAEDYPSVETRFFQVAGAHRSFHPKSYIFKDAASCVAYVGSSNLSKTALTDGVEWNLRLISAEDGEGLQQIQDRFEHLWSHTQTEVLTKRLIEEYEARAPVLEGPEIRRAGPQPHPIQALALTALKETRGEGHRRGLVVLATGLGKTYLSAFDFRAMGGERALFVAHREEILERSAESWATIFPGRSIGMLTGKKSQTEADLLFASVQTLARQRQLQQFHPDHFDYIVIDEFHHAAATTYRKVIEYFKPRFLLGLTATPDRTDGASLLELCGDNVVFRRDLVHGISAKLLVPFHYYGVKDSLDFAPIPWRSGRFDRAQLTKSANTKTRAAQALDEYRDKGPAKRCTLAFCCSTEHADYMAEYFNTHGHPAASVHSKASSAPRAQSLKRLKSHELEIICAVDIFNEGLDVPSINTIIMLRPTESPIIFLQQLGRGLRQADDKPFLTVIDFIGNHRSFLQKPQALVYLSGHDLTANEALRRLQNDAFELPEGCSVEIETEALDMLAKLSKRSSEDVLIYEYLNFRDAQGRRPTASELLACGTNFKAIRANYGSWFSFIEEQGDLDEAAARVLHKHGPWFADLLTTNITKSFKMIALQALIDAGALFEGMSVQSNAERSHKLIQGNLLLYREAAEQPDRMTFGPDYVRRWKEMPLRVWHDSKSTHQQWFSLDGDFFNSHLKVEDVDRDTFERMTNELVGFRLQEHVLKLRAKHAPQDGQTSAVLKVSHSSKKPILRFDRKNQSDIPLGETTVYIDGQAYEFRFVKIAVNVATGPDSRNNILPSILRQWFGLRAGHPGTHHEVDLYKSSLGWQLQKHGAEPMADVLPFPTLPLYENLQVACGAFAKSGETVDEAAQVTIVTEFDVDQRTHFVIRASGDSMDGGAQPIRDGDLVLCEWRVGGGTQDIDGKAWLIVGYDEADVSLAAIKVPIKQERGWRLRSWNTKYEDQDLPTLTRLEPVAKVLGTVQVASIPTETL